jgi:hypothetical protein
MREEMKKMVEKHNIGIDQQIIHISGDRMRSFCTDISGKWVPVEDVEQLINRIQQLEIELYGSR